MQNILIYFYQSFLNLGILWKCLDLFLSLIFKNRICKISWFIFISHFWTWVFCENVLIYFYHTFYKFEFSVPWFIFIKHFSVAGFVVKSSWFIFISHFVTSWLRNRSKLTNQKKANSDQTLLLRFNMCLGILWEVVDLYLSLLFKSCVSKCLD